MSMESGSGGSFTGRVAESSRSTNFLDVVLGGTGRDLFCLGLFGRGRAHTQVYPVQGKVTVAGEIPEGAVVVLCTRARPPARANYVLRERFKKDGTSA